MARPGTDCISRKLPDRTARDDAYASLDGARYHLNQIRHLTEVLGLRTGEHQNMFHWHLRALFWELVAVRDSIEVAEDRYRQAADTLTKLENAEWFKEVNCYRNTAHQSFHVVQAMRRPRTGKIVLWALESARRGAVREILSTLSNTLS